MLQLNSEKLSLICVLQFSFNFSNPEAVGSQIRMLWRQQYYKACLCGGFVVVVGFLKNAGTPFRSETQPYGAQLIIISPLASYRPRLGGLCVYMDCFSLVFVLGLGQYDGTLYNCKVKHCLKTLSVWSTSEKLSNWTEKVE